MNTQSETYSDICVCCGKPVPEGRMVCYSCETESSKLAPSIPSNSISRIKKMLAIKKEHADEP